MTMIEVLIGMTLLLGVMLAVVDVTSMSQKSASSVSQTTDWNNLVSQIQLLLNNEVSCKGALKGLTLPPAWFGGSHPPYTMLNLTLNGSAIATVGQPPQGMQVTGLALTNTGASGTPVTAGSPPITYTQYFANFTITGQKTSNAVGKANYSQTLLVTLYLDAAQTIQDCYGQYSSAQACYDFGGNYNSTGTPKCTAFPHNCGGPGNAFQTVLPSGSANAGGTTFTLWCDGTNSAAPNGAQPGGPPAGLVGKKVLMSGGAMCTVDGSSAWNTGGTLSGSMPDPSGVGWSGNCVGASGNPSASLALSVICCDI
jgi:hypothetical protein